MLPSRALPAALLAASLLAPGCTPTQVRYAPLESAPPPAGDVRATLFLVGDAGEASEERAAVLAHLSAAAAEAAGGGSGPPVVVAYLGDNLYPEGLPETPTPADSVVLAGQIEAVPALPNVRAVFVPGNHDWGHGARLDVARRAVLGQAEWIERHAGPVHARMLPEDACPGPAVEDVGPALRLVFADTEALLRGGEATCDGAAAFHERLGAALRESGGRHVVVLTHHPLASGGQHAGNIAPFQRGPLLHYLIRRAGVSVQDFASTRYTEMAGAFERTFRESGAPLVFASGHDHSLQVIRLGGTGEPAYQIVSGAGSKSERARRVEGTRYATERNGYVRLDVRASDVRLTVYALPEGQDAPQAVYACTLSEAAAEGECPEAPLAAAR
ncbi:MAG TPA: hypothetical protein VFQ22_11415 [Longimicrobiales bacterium]|nr:hypothetical protein [Longimicrobiales bacterium]